MNIVFLVCILTIIPLIQSAYATELENMEILANEKSFGQDVVIHMEFGDDVFKQGRVHPSVKSGTLDVFDSTFDLKNSEVTLYGNSFVVKDFDADYKLIMYAKKTESNQYSINLKLFDGILHNYFFGAMLEKMQQKLEEEKQPTQTKNLLMKIKQSLRVFWEEEHRITIKTFDKNMNPTPDFSSAFGLQHDLDINIQITNHRGEEYRILNGAPDQNGVYQGSFFVPSTLSLPGKYSVRILATDGINSVEENTFFYILGQAPKSDPDPNPP